MSFRNRAHREDESLRPAASGERGFTLLETTIALVVMMVVGLGATSLFFYAVRSNSGGEQRSQALAIAQQRLEALRALPYNATELNLGQTISTVVLHDVVTGDASASGASVGDGGQTYGGVQTYGSGAATQNGGATTYSPDSGTGGNPTPTPVGGTGTGGSDDEYKVVVDVEGLPEGSANPTRKVITIRVTPENGYGANSWINQNPVIITIHRSSPATGPFRL